MPSQFAGRPLRRFIVVVIFFAIVTLLWRNPDFTPSFPGRATEMINGYKYAPSRFDWSRIKPRYAVGDIKSPPSGRPKRLPKVQAKFGSDAQNEKTLARKTAIKNKFLKSWEAYKTYAWTKDELMPLSGRGKNTFCGWSAQLVDALDTLWIMGLKDEFRLAVAEVALIDWQSTSQRKINLFETTIRYLGGLLSAYELSEERVLLLKAIELGDALFAAFDTPNRLPVKWLEFERAKNGRQEAETSMSIAVGGTLFLEFTRLSQLTKDPKYYDAAERVKKFFNEYQPKSHIPGLWPRDLNYREKTGTENHRYTMGAGADSFYEYLPKMHALLGGLDPEYEKMTVAALDATRDNLLYRPMTPKDENILLSGVVIFNDDGNARYYAEMHHLTCFAGGMYALAAKLLKRDDYLDIGSRLTGGCVWAYDSFPTNIMPEISEHIPCKDKNGPCEYKPESFPSNSESPLPDGFVRAREPGYKLRPEAIESVFYMWRITGDQKWRDAAWRMWEGIVKATETQLAFASIENVAEQKSEKVDSMETFWLAETLKYFYLIFEDDHVLNLDEWPASLRAFTTSCRLHDVAAKNHYERLNIRHDATPAEIKKSFYQLSKVHHPDANPSDPSASHTFSLLSESYTVLSDPPRRASYDRDVLRLHQQHHQHQHRHPAGASYHSTNPAGGRPPSGLSRRRGTFRGPPPSFYRSGGWGAHTEKRRRAHEESTGGAESAAAGGTSSQHSETMHGGSSRHGGMGPGSDPFGHRHHDEVWHFDKQGHERTQRHEDRRRWERGRRAVDDDGVEFEPQMSLGAHFLVVLGILATSFVVPVVYLQFSRLGRRKQDGY
ncbi:unnamed protein product [Clonostachys rosea f. rosea IK726]|uniref:Uncharacterized protein n=1 Tax=Clonostachys rosea f. rosea IK726 TaxID=1349383 RepID=A0ACA9U923_BIOOC|nr:unnamed protein product [Clonostachys rosea f. rosea IK726]